MVAAQMMRAIQLKSPGPPSALQLTNLPVPVPTRGQVLIRVKSFGINRSEVLTRRFGRAPIGPVKLPRVLGVEAAGVVEAAPGYEGQFPAGTIAMTAVGGMGINFDGGYAEYVCVPKENVQIVSATHLESLGWATLGALPVMLQTAHGSLFRSLKLQRDDTLIVRGGTSSIGLTAVSIAKAYGARVVATTRKTDEETVAMLKKAGADAVVVDGGSIKSEVSRLVADGADKVLDLVGGSTLIDSLSCLKSGGICCLLGVLGGSPVVPDFNAIAAIQTGRYLTAYGERTFASTNLPLDELLRQITEGKLDIKIGKVLPMEQIVTAHELMESDSAHGKIIVLTDSNTTK